MTALLCMALLAQPAPAVGPAPTRLLIDEVVAVVDAHSITLSELAAETRIHLAEEQGAQVALLPLDRRLLAASLRRTIEERVVLSQVERSRLFDLDRAEVEALFARLRGRFSAQGWERFQALIELTDEEIQAVLLRETRVGRYLDNRLRLAAQLRDAELAEATGGRVLTAAEREALRDKLSREKYQRLLTELLADLRRRATVRVLDPLDDGAAARAG